MKTVFFLATLALAGCAPTTSTTVDTFPWLSLTALHHEVNFAHRYDRRNCLPVAKQKYLLFHQRGVTDMEIVVYRIPHPEFQTHAMLRVGNLIYDNGYVSEDPFLISEMNEKGVKVHNTW